MQSSSFEMLSPNEMRLSSRGVKESIGMSGKNLPSFMLAGMLVAPCITAGKSKFLQYHLSMIFPAILGVMTVGAIEYFFARILYNAVYYGIFYATFNEFAAGFVGVLLAWLIHIIFMAVPIIILVTGLINAIGGKAKDLPLIGRIKMIFEK